MSFTDAPDFDPNTGQRDGAHPRFYMDTIQDKAKSEAEGMPRFRNVEMVEVMIPGDRLNTPVFQVTDVHRKRWPQAYKAFRENQEAPVEGTPLDQLPGMTKARVLELQYFHIRTIEQLAGMPDDLLMKAAAMDGRALRDKAKRWVDAAQGNASEERLAAEIRARDEKIASMEQTQAQMQEAIARLTAQAQAGNVATTTPAAPSPPAES
jgi:hypothetical protein